MARNVSHLPRLAVANTSRPQMPGQLHRGHADPAGGGVDQHSTGPA